jgi:hypothetical protein
MIDFHDAGKHVPGLSILWALEVIDDIVIAPIADPPTHGSFVLKVFRDKLE